MGRMKNSLYRWEQLPGKTVKGVHTDFISDEVLLTFTDDTFVVLTVFRGYENDCEIKIADVPNFLETGGYDDCDGLLVKAGIITKEELDAAREAGNAKIRAQREAADRRAYEQLKARFGE